MYTVRKFPWPPGAEGRGKKIVFLKLVLDSPDQLGNILLKKFFDWEALSWCTQSENSRGRGQGRAGAGQDFC